MKQTPKQRSADRNVLSVSSMDDIPNRITTSSIPPNMSHSCGYKEIKSSSSVLTFLEAVRQFKAIARRERMQPDNQEKGLRLLPCLQSLEKGPQEHHLRIVGVVQPPDIAQNASNQ
ncbi:hypothetical protein PsorP6_014476 [Peronosclerospora sorghi]|uniref:Uncharacterized protein n=1 Tax=Peronosclerospora sorghi TaxID=230839 RepID=A0ACC0VSJ7_9STRA|nr:hypothetical protein PsorP6_014476 [Peronosclerospora sorghi]